MQQLRYNSRLKLPDPRRRLFFDKSGIKSAAKSALMIDGKLRTAVASTPPRGFPKYRGVNAVLCVIVMIAKHLFLSSAILCRIFLLNIAQRLSENLEKFFICYLVKKKRRRIRAIFTGLLKALKCQTKRGFKSIGRVQSRPMSFLLQIISRNL